MLRRKFLSAVAAITGTAGCSQLSDSDSPTEPTQQETETTQQTSVPPHDHSSEAEGGGSLRPQQASLRQLSGPITGGQTLTDIAGGNLSIEDGTLSASQTEPAARTAGTGADRVASPGEVQSTIDEIAELGGGRVALRAAERYAPNTTWHVRENVTLDYGGATVEPAADVDVHLMSPRSRVIDPRVELRDVSFSSSVFLWDSSRVSGFVDDTCWPYVQGGLVTGSPSEGTLFYLHEGSERAIDFIWAQTNSDGIGTVVDMHREDDHGINGCRFSGHHDSFRTLIHTRESGSSAEFRNNTHGNIFDFSVQARDVTDVGWNMEVGQRNQWRGIIWDVQNYETLWRIHDSAGGKNVIWRNKGTIGLDPFIDDRLGDSTNSVLVPHQLGIPVTDL